MKEYGYGSELLRQYEGVEEFKGFISSIFVFHTSSTCLVRARIKMSRVKENEYEP